MDIKQFEIRDAGTFIPVMAIRIDGTDGYLIRRAGFGANPQVLLIHLTKLAVNYSPMSWRNNTMQVAHKHIKEAWSELNSESVIDVQYLKGERDEPKRSERFSDTA